MTVGFDRQDEYREVGWVLQKGGLHWCERMQTDALAALGFTPFIWNSPPSLPKGLARYLPQRAQETCCFLFSWCRDTSGSYSKPNWGSLPERLLYKCLSFCHFCFVAMKIIKLLCWVFMEKIFKDGDPWASFRAQLCSFMEESDRVIVLFHAHHVCLTPHSLHLEATCNNAPTTAHFCQPASAFYSCS